jgi:glycerate 2-kinase
MVEGCPIVTPRTHRPPASTPSWRGARGIGISHTLLIACAPLGPRLPSATVARAIADGLQNGGLPEPDICLMPSAPGEGGDVRGALDDLGFDARMRRARAVVIVTKRLHERALAGSITFEIATRARQAGVPAYALTAENALDAFDARILDLQLILQAGSRAALVNAAHKLAEVA